MKKQGNERISCSVHNCKHCDTSNNSCILEKIRVCNYKDNNDKESTMCDSYKERKNL